MIKIKKGSLVLFQGDSVTDCGRMRGNDEDLGNSYVMQVGGFLREKCIKVVNRAVGGDKLIDLLERYDADFRDVHPDYVFIMIGVNDVWHIYPKVPAKEEFRKNYELLIDKIQNELKATVIILEPFIMGYNIKYTCMRKNLLDLIEVTRELARDYKLQYVAFENDLATKLIFEDEKLYSKEGIHPYKLGYDVISEKIIKNIEVID